MKSRGRDGDLPRQWTRICAYTQPPHVAKAITDAGFVIVKDPRRWPERNGETKTGKLASNRYQ